jgi:hypothetical protein
MIEQPLFYEDLLQHAKLQREIRTPLCLDESIRSAADAAAAIELGSCRIVNIKQGRVGGLLEARRVHHVALAAGVPVWCGGMLETGVGRAANLALAGLPGFTLPGTRAPAAATSGRTSPTPSSSMRTAPWPFPPGQVSAWCRTPTGSSGHGSARASREKLTPWRDRLLTAAWWRAYRSG